uniref:RT_RNaseH domain-containing protein n=1 Tax=Strongyloides venezuelensis TaxID=75913 RepID=A0A0K0FSP4_STRVS
MKTIFRRIKRNDADLLAFKTAVELLKPKWRRMQENALDKASINNNRSLTKSEKNYPSIKLEAIALIYTLRMFKSFIYGKQTQVYTDHKPLLALIKNKNLKSILEQFQLAIMEFDVKIDYVKGPDNHIADYLSRETFNLITVIDVAFPVIINSYDTPYNINNFIYYYTAENN